MAPETRIIVLICSLVFLFRGANGNLCNLEGINEVKLTMSWVQYLRDQQVADEEGNLLASRYLVNENGVAYSGELDYKVEDGGQDKQMDNLHAIMELVGCERNNKLINASRLRIDLVNNPDGNYPKVWGLFAWDMLRAIEVKRVNDLAEAKDFLKVFTRHVFGPWQDVIYSRYYSILRADNQDAAHLAVLRAHGDSFALVRERMFEKLVGVWPEVGQQLPTVPDWNEVHGRIQLDHIRYEFKALKIYRDLRKSLLDNLDPSERELIIEVLPIGIDGGFLNSHYQDYEVMDRMVYLCQDGDRREIDHKYLVKLDSGDRVRDEQGRELDANEQAPEFRRFLWRLIHKAIAEICLRVINSVAVKSINQSYFDRIHLILFYLKEAVLQRANALNGMIDEELSQEFLTDFYAHRDYLNEIFDQIRDKLPSEQVEIYENLMQRLGLVLEHDANQHVNRFKLKADRESLRTIAKGAFYSALDRLSPFSLELAKTEVSVKKLFDEVADCYEDDGPRDRFRQAFQELQSQIVEYSKFLTCNLDNAKSIGETEVSESQKTPEVAMAKYREFDSIGAEDLATKLKDKSEPVQWKIVRERMKYLEEKLVKAMRKVVGDLNEFRTYSVAHAIRTSDERLPNLIQDVFKLTNDTLNEIGESKNFKMVSSDQLELQLKRVQLTMEHRGRSMSLRPSCHRNSVSREPELRTISNK